LRQIPFFSTFRILVPQKEKEKKVRAITVPKYNSSITNQKKKKKKELLHVVFVLATNLPQKYKS